MKKANPVLMVFVLFSFSLLFMANLCSDDVENEYFEAKIGKNSEAAVVFDADEYRVDFLPSTIGLDTVIIEGESNGAYIYLVLYMDDISSPPMYFQPTSITPVSGTFFVSVLHYKGGSTVWHNALNGELRFKEYGYQSKTVRGNFNMQLFEQSSGDTLKISQGYFYLKD